MSSSYYSRRLRYGNNTYNDGGYVSDGGYHVHKSTSRLNKSRSVEDLTSARPNVSNTIGSLSSRSLADVYGSTSARRNRFSSDSKPNRLSDGPTGYIREDIDGRYGRTYGSRESIADLARNNSFDRRFSDAKRGVSFRRGEINGGTLTIGEVSRPSDKYRRDSSNQVKYRISGEIIRDSSSADDIRGYYSDTGLLSQGRKDDIGYESEKPYGSKSSPSRRNMQSQQREDRPVNWRSRSLGRSEHDGDLESERLRKGSGPSGYDGRDHDAEDQRRRNLAPGQRRHPSDRDNLPSESFKPRSRSPSPIRRSTSGLSGKLGSPSRRMRKSPSMSMDPGNNGDLSGAAVFPVCSRWPNCTVCSIDIPNSQVVSIT